MAGLSFGQIMAAACMGAGAAYILTLLHPEAGPGLTLVTGAVCTLTALVSFRFMGLTAPEARTGGAVDAKGGGAAGTSKRANLPSGAGARRPKAGKGRG